MRAEQKILQLIKSKSQHRDAGSLSPEPTSVGSFSQEPTFNTNFEHRNLVQTTSLTNDVAHIKQTLAMLQQNVGACLEALHEQVANLKGRVEKQEQFSGRKNNADDNVQDMALSAAVKAEVKAQLADAFSNGLAANVVEECCAKIYKQEAEMRRLEDIMPAARKSETTGADSMQEGVSADQLFSRAELQAHYELQSSIWDACMLILFPALGWFSDLQLLFGVLLNICCQLFFCLTVQANMTEEIVSESTVEAAKHWRSSIGHSVENVNAISGTSLVARLCAQDPATSAANAQLTIYGDLVSFISPTNEHFQSLVFLNGRYLCMFGLMLWYMLVANDIQSNLKLASALFSLPRGQPQLTFTDDSGIKIQSISAWQCVLMMLLSIIPRMTTAFLLGISGTWFLSYTSSMEDLLLNAIALEFILNVDEMMFVLAPHRARLLMERLVPIEMKLIGKRQDEGQQSLRSNFFAFLADMKTFIRVLAICVLLVVVDQSYLIPYQKHMQDVTKWLCHGRKDFAYAINKASGVVHFAETEPYSDAYPTGYAKESVLDITGLLLDRSSSTPWYSSYKDIAYHHQHWQTIQHINAFDVEFSASWPSCWDVFHVKAVASGVKAQQRALRSLLGNESLMSCSDVNISLCHESDMNFLRASCPYHCGCDNPWSGNFYATVSNGCPRACEMWNQEKLDVLNLSKSLQDMSLQDMKPYLKECQDVPSEILSAKKEWQWWVSAFYDTIKSLDPEYFEKYAYPKEVAVARGCSFFADAMSLGFTPCNPESSPGRSGRAWCPSTCNCAAGMLECPGQTSTCKCQMGSCSKLYGKTTGDGTTNCSSVRLQDSSCPAVIAAQSSGQ